MNEHDKNQAPADFKVSKENIDQTLEETKKELLEDFEEMLRQFNLINVEVEKSQENMGRIYILYGTSIGMIAGLLISQLLDLNLMYGTTMGASVGAFIGGNINLEVQKVVIKTVRTIKGIKERELANKTWSALPEETRTIIRAALKSATKD